MMMIDANATICPYCRSTQPSSKKKMAYAILLGIILISFARACTQPTETEMATKNNTDQLLIVRALISNNIKDCGDMTYTLNAGQTSEYTVNCSKDGKQWKTYTVWGQTGKVMAGKY